MDSNLAESQAQQREGFTVIPLRTPVTVGGDTVRQLRMREPAVEDTLAVEKTMRGGTDGEREVRLFANLCEVPPSTIEKLKMYDYKRVQDVYRDFLS